MNSQVTWDLSHIQQVNNYLIIKGEQLFKSSLDKERVYRACYALPSDPEQMDDWLDKHLNEKEAEQLFEFIFA